MGQSTRLACRHASCYWPSSSLYSVWSRHVGDIIILLTDGLAETPNSEGELFGAQRVIDELHRNRSLSAAEIVNSVFKRVADFSQGAEQEDDYTMIVAKVL